MVLCAGKSKRNPYENEEQHKERVVSHYIVYFTSFVIVFSYSTILAGLWPYLNKLDPTAEKTFLGYLVGISALGQTIFSPIIGYLSNKFKSTRFLFEISLVICLISYLIHATLESFSSYRKYWLLFSRLLAGVGAANISICRSHISTTTLIKERRSAISILSSCSTIALALGAVAQFVFVFLGDEGFWVIEGYIKLNMYTSVAWVLILLTVINMLLFIPVIFKEHSMIRKEKTISGESYKTDKYKYVAVAFVLLNFLITFNFMFTKILGTPLAMDEFAMDRQAAVRLNSLVMIGGTVVSFVAILAINPLCKLMSETKALFLGLLVLVAGRCCFYPWSNDSLVVYDNVNLKNASASLGCPISQTWCATEEKLTFPQYILGNMLENIGYSISITLTLAIFSKILGSKQQGTWMGILTGIGSVARVISPVFISSLYTKLGPKVVTIITNTMFVVITIILLKIAHHYIKMYKSVDNTEKREEANGGNLLPENCDKVIVVAEEIK